MHRALVAAAERIACDEELRDAVSEASRLSREMSDFALTTSASAITEEALASLLARGRGRTPVSLAGVVLAGNVTTAALRAVSVPLGLGVPVLVKASSRDDVVASAFARALRETDEAMGARLAIMTYEGGEPALDAALVRACDALHVYGSDETLTAFRALGATRLVAHGHGLGLAVVSTRADLVAAAADIAKDVAAYDQRGCLSPHAVYVIGDEARQRAFGEALLAALERVPWPRGAFDAGAAVERHAARALAAMDGDVLEGASSTVVLTDVFRASPLHRFVRVIARPNEAEVHAEIDALAAFVTCVGVAGEISEAMLYAAQRWPRTTLVPAGTMQLPRLDARVDGMPCTHGFFEEDFS